MTCKRWFDVFRLGTPSLLAILGETASSSRSLCLQLVLLTVTTLVFVFSRTADGDAARPEAMATGDWQKALPWLRGGVFSGFFTGIFSHITTPAEAEELRRHFGAHPQQLAVADSHGRLPLHCAARYQRGEHALDVVTFLFTMYQQSAQQGSKDGSLPLHYAAQYQKGEHAMAIVIALVAAYPQGAQQKDARQHLPVDLAQRNSNLPESCVAILREAAEHAWTPLPGNTGTPPGGARESSVVYNMVTTW